MGRVRIPHLLLGAAAAVLLVASVVGFVGRDSDRQSETSPAAAGSVTIIDFAFDPSELTANVGETITWTNEDSTAHTVTSDGDGPLDSGDVNGGATYEATFDEPGSYPYVCTIHPTMQGTVEVTA